MSDYKFYIPISVRYFDLDVHWHVNHSRFLTFMEQARMEYLMHLGLFDGKTFIDLKAIVADVHITYLAPIVLGQNIRVGTRTNKIGKKSIEYGYQIEDTDTGEILATAEIINVAYNFHEQKSMLVPDEWRKRMSEFEERDF